MMKKPKITIGKKIFALIFISFCLINCFNIFMDYHREKNTVFKQLENEYHYYLAHQLQERYHQKGYQLQDSFYQDINNTLKTEDGYLTYSVFVLNPDLQIVYNQLDQKRPILRVQDIRDGISTMLSISLDTIDTNIRSQIEKEIKNHLPSNDLKIEAAAPSITQIGDNHISTNIPDLSYLAIDGHVVFDQRQTEDEIKSFTFMNYESPHCYLSSSSYFEEDIEISHIDYFQKTESVLNEISTILPDQQNSQYEQVMQFEDGEGTFYDVLCLPLMHHGAQMDENSEYDFDDIDGYLVFYNYDLYAAQKITHRVIYAKMIIYMMSLVLCICLSLLLAHLLTRRIKKISQSTLAIANNDFDIHLDEKSKDELGVLSHNINHMSQQLKNTIQQLNQEIEYVKKLEGMRKEFIANFTHEIKTPLSIINGYIELLDVSQDEEKKQQYLSAIHQEVNRINQLIHAMLDLSRLESGHVKLQIQDVDIEDLLTTTIEMFAPLLEKKHIHVIMGDEFPHIQADAQELQIVFKNFISNAMKHTPENGSIYIEYHQGILTFENEGEPISDEQKAIIWETYVSGDREGTGLGLAICRSILDLHHFSYDVCNTRRGVQFQIDFNQTKNNI